MLKRLKFTKMQTLGNDFIVLNGLENDLDLNPTKLQQWSDRKRGIGFDQCLILKKSNDYHIDFYYQIFNADGSEVGQCGNGARCVAKYIEYYKLHSRNLIRLATKTTKLIVTIKQNDVIVEFMPPKLDPVSLPMSFTSQQDLYRIKIADNKYINFHALSVGNPHIGVNVDDVDEIDINYMGKFLSEHAYFPEQTNVEFFQVLNKNQLKLRVYERGCGETPACGSGAVAAAVMGRLYYGMDSHVDIFLPGGRLQVTYPHHKDTDNDKVYLIGDANFVYEGWLF